MELADSAPSSPPKKIWTTSIPSLPLGSYVRQIAPQQRCLLSAVGQWTQVPLQSRPSCPMMLLGPARSVNDTQKLSQSLRSRHKDVGRLWEKHVEKKRKKSTSQASKDRKKSRSEKDSKRKKFLSGEGQSEPVEKPVATEPLVPTRPSTSKADKQRKRQRRHSDESDIRHGQPEKPEASVQSGVAGAVEPPRPSLKHAKARHADFCKIIEPHPNAKCHETEAGVGTLPPSQRDTVHLAFQRRTEFLRSESRNL